MAAGTPTRQPKVPTWLRVSFAIAVLLAIGAAAVLALGATAPKDVPDWALKSVAVYRFELLVAVFIGMYAPLTALFLAAQGRAFTKLTAGQASIEAEQIEKVEQATSSNTEAMENVLLVLGAFKEKLIELDTRTDPTLAAERAEEDEEEKPGEEPGPLE